MNFHITSPQTPEQWQAYYTLRWQILRAPWGQAPGSERDEFEADAWHGMALDTHAQVIAVGRLHRLDSLRAQIRYMAVAASVQGQGVGSAMLAELEAQAGAWQVREIILHARQTASSFYLARGYRILAEGETLFGLIPHVQMQKTLRADAS